jgi:hypothetical protein
MGTSVQIVPDVVHNLTSRDMQRTVADRMVAFLAPELVALHAFEALQLQYEASNSTRMGDVVAVAADHQPGADQLA